MVNSSISNLGKKVQGIVLAWGSRTRQAEWRSGEGRDARRYEDNGDAIVTTRGEGNSDGAKEGVRFLVVLV